jgi:type I restriction enzyme S subunit
MSNKAASKTMKLKLRFPEFRATPNWKEKSLAEALSPIVREKKKPVDAYTGLGMRSHGKGTFLKNLVNPEKNAMEYLYEVQHDDLIVSITFAWEGAIAIAKPTDTGALVSHRFPTYVFKRDTAIPDFFRYIILDKQFVYNLGVISPGGAGRNRVLNKNDFLKLGVFLPEVTEQKKIAECLNSLDDLIAAQGQKLDAFKAHKNGLMQQLFPRASETVPRLRFPEFRNAPAWDKTTIGAIGSFYYGKSAPKWSLEKDAPTPCVRYGELYTKFGPTITETYSRTNIDPKNLRFSKGGEILVPRVGEKPEDFGKYCCYLTLGNIAIGEMISVFETEQNPLFYTYYFRNLYRQFAKVVEGQHVKNLYYAELEPLPIHRPSLHEQQRIAACLSSLDDLITPETQKLATLKTHKQSLMQQLFPTLEEVES